MNEKINEIYDAFTNKLTKKYDTESAKTKVYLSESNLLYGLPSQKIETYAKLKKETEELFKLQSLDLIEFILENYIR